MKSLPVQFSIWNEKTIFTPCNDFIISLIIIIIIIIIIFYNNNNNNDDDDDNKNPNLLLISKLTVKTYLQLISLKKKKKFSQSTMFHKLLLISIKKIVLIKRKTLCSFQLIPIYSD